MSSNAGLASLVGVVLVSASVSAEVRSGQVVEVRPDEVVQGDLYVAGSQVTVLGRVTGDLLVLANTVDIKGVVDGDVLGAAGTLNVTGKVLGSVRGAAAQMSLLGPVGRDAAVAGGQLEIGPQATVGRDLLLAAGSAEVSGPVKGDVWAAANMLGLRAGVGGNVEARVGQLDLGDDARVAGNLRYESAKGARRANGASVAGVTEHRALEATAWQGGRWVAVLWLRSMVAMFGLGLMLVLVFPTFTRRSVSALKASPWKSLGLGLAAALGIPGAAMVIVIIGALIGGWWLGMLLFGLYVTSLAVCFPMVGVFVGRWILDRLRRPGAHVVLALLIGVGLMTVLLRVPVVGALVVIVTLVFGLGAMILGETEGRRVAT